jgi:hypothetical protein
VPFSAVVSTKLDAVSSPAPLIGVPVTGTVAPVLR